MRPSPNVARRRLQPAPSGKGFRSQSCDHWKNEGEIQGDRKTFQEAWTRASSLNFQAWRPIFKTGCTPEQGRHQPWAWKSYRRCPKCEDLWEHSEEEDTGFRPCSQTTHGDPLLTRQHWLSRLEFARRHIGPSFDDWRIWHFSRWNKVKFLITRWEEPNIEKERREISWRRGSIMFWAGISLEAHTELVILRGRSMNADRCIHSVLKDHVVPFAPFVGDEFLFSRIMRDLTEPEMLTISSIMSESQAWIGRLEVQTWIL